MKISFARSLNQITFWIAQLAILLGSFSIASLAFATIDDPNDSTGYQEGKRWVVVNSRANTPALACMYSTAVYNKPWKLEPHPSNPAMYECYYENSAGTGWSFQGNAYTENCNGETTGPCAPLEPIGCDFDQDPVELYTLIPKDLAPENMFLYADKVTAGECLWAIQDTGTEFEIHRDSANGDLYIKQTYVPYSDIDPADPATSPAVPTENIPQTAEPLEDDSREDTASTVIEEPVVTQVGDATQTVEVKTEIETAGAGTVVEQTPGQKITVTEYGGVRKTETVTTTTVVNPDGSETIVEETTTAYAQIPGQKVTYATDNSAVNWTTLPGMGNSKTTTKTTTKDGTGKTTGQGTKTTYGTGYTGTGLPGSTTGQTGTGTGAGGTGASSSEFCKANPTAEACAAAEEEETEYDNGPDDKGLYEAGELTYEGVLGDFQTDIKTAGFYQDITGFFDFDISGGSCPTWSVGTINVMGFDLGNWSMDLHCQSPFNAILAGIGAVILAAAGVVAFRIAIL